MFNRSVNSIISDINKKIRLLNKASDFHSGLSAEHRVAAEKHNTFADEALKESMRARDIANKLSNLIS